MSVSGFPIVGTTMTDDLPGECATVGVYRQPFIAECGKESKLCMDSLVGDGVAHGTTGGFYPEQ